MQTGSPWEPYSARETVEKLSYKKREKDIDVHSDAVPLTPGSFIDATVTLAQQNPDAVAFGIVAGAAYYGLSRIQHNSMFYMQKPTA